MADVILGVSRIVATADVILGVSRTEATAVYEFSRILEMEEIRVLQRIPYTLGASRCVFPECNRNM
jgi:hypothetical protein